jgi:hypothetical protein
LHPQNHPSCIQHHITAPRASAKMRYASCSHTSSRHPHLSLFLRASLIAQRPAPARRGLTQARPFFFSSVPQIGDYHPAPSHSGSRMNRRRLLQTLAIYRFSLSA